MVFASFLVILVLFFGNIFSQTEDYRVEERGRLDLVDYSTEGSINGSVGVSFFANPGNMDVGREASISPELPDGLVFFNKSWNALGALIDSYDNRTCSITPSTGTICWEHSSVDGEDYIFNINEASGDFMVGFLSISVGKSHVCSIIDRDDSRPIYCWGDNWMMQLGHPIIVDPVQSNFIHPLGNWSWIEVSTGSDHTCARNTMQEVYCWGSGVLGQLGNGDFEDSAVPVKVILPLDQDIKRLVSGSHSNCVLFTGGEVFCWGWGGIGQLGSGETSSHSTPLKVNLGSERANEIYSGLTHSCATTLDDEIFCWGSNSHGEISPESDEFYANPKKLDFGSESGLISLGSKHTCTYSRATRLCLGDIKLNEEPIAEVPEEISSGSGFNCIIAVMRTVHCDGVMDFQGDIFVPLEIESLFVPREIVRGSIGGIPKENHSLSHEISLSNSMGTIQLVISIDSESDWDLDGWKNTDEEACGTDPEDPYSKPTDIDGDKHCDYLDWDDDGDWVSDGADAFPNDPTEWVDRDGDGIGANADDFEITIAFWGMMLTSSILIGTAIVEVFHMTRTKEIVASKTEEE